MSKLVGGILQAVGILIAGASGLCSLFVAVSIIQSVIQGVSSLGYLVLVLIGGIPFTIGFALFRWGRLIVRRANEDIETTHE